VRRDPRRRLNLRLVAIRRLVDNWTVSADITAGPLLRSINKAGRIWATALLQR
jgi:muramidase (phage lysozyme)